MHGHSSDTVHCTIWVLLLAELNSWNNIKTFLFAWWRQPKQELICKKKWQKILVEGFSIYIRKNLRLILFQYKRTLIRKCMAKISVDTFYFFSPLKLQHLKYLQKNFANTPDIFCNAWSVECPALKAMLKSAYVRRMKFFLSVTCRLGIQQELSIESIQHTHSNVLQTLLTSAPNLHARLTSF